MPEREPLIPKHGGYRKLKSFQVAQLIYDVTVRFCDRFIDRYSRTHDQMVQAARSGVQNIAEGSQASGTSIKTELLLTHLTDLQNTEIKYAEEARQTLLAWGRLPYLVYSGKAVVQIRLNGAERFQVWALSTSGRRIAQLKTTISENTLRFEADVAGDPAVGARMLYEIVHR